MKIINFTVIIGFTFLLNSCTTNLTKPDTVPSSSDSKVSPCIDDQTARLPAAAVICKDIILKSAADPRLEYIKNRIQPIWVQGIGKNLLAHNAIATGRLDLLLELLNAGATINKDAEDGVDLVKSAIRAENAEALKILFAHGGKIPRLNPGGDTIYILNNTKNVELRTIFESQKKFESSQKEVSDEQKLQKTIQQGTYFISEFKKGNLIRINPTTTYEICEAFIKKDMLGMLTEFLSSYQIASEKNILDVFTQIQRPLLIKAIRQNQLNILEILYSHGLRITTAQKDKDYFEDYHYDDFESAVNSPTTDRKIVEYINNKEIEEKNLIRQEANKGTVENALRYLNALKKKLSKAERLYSFAELLNNSAGKLLAMSEKDFAIATSGKNTDKHDLFVKLLHAGSNLKKDDEGIGYDLVKEAIRAENDKALNTLIDFGAEMPYINNDGRTARVLSQTQNKKLLEAFERLKENDSKNQTTKAFGANVSLEHLVHEVTRESVPAEGMTSPENPANPTFWNKLRRHLHF